jgi:cytoskeletal protein CcmA (bactofilin family)
MTQYVINIGALPNDGTGDPLRTAFNETNLNFNQIFAAGPVLSNVQIANNTILTTNTNGNLVLAPNGIGVVQSNVHIVPSLANIRNLGAADRRWSTIYAQYIDTNQINLGNSLVLSGNLSVGGNLSVTGDIVYIGNLVTDAKTIQLANTAGTANAANGSGITVGANDAIATFLFDSATNTWDTNIGLAVNGNITGTGLAVSDATVYGNVNAINGNFTGNIVVNTVQVGTIQLNPVGGPNTLSNITVVDDTVFEGNVDVDGALFVMGNVSSDYFIGDGSQLTGIITWTTVPVSNTSVGIPGQVAYDSGGNLYVCVSSNTWSKFSGTTSW